MAKKNRWDMNGILYHTQIYIYKTRLATSCPLRKTAARGSGPALNETIMSGASRSVAHAHSFGCTLIFQVEPSYLACLIHRRL